MTSTVGIRIHRTTHVTPGRSASTVPVIGVTGGVGSGKTLVAQHFVSWGAALVSGDEIGRCVLDHSSTVRRRLARAFGSDILNGDQVRRDILADRAFASNDSILALNSIVHPPLIRELNKQVARLCRSGAHPAVVIDAALLAEWGVGRIHWDALVAVWAPQRLRMKWMRKRGWSDREIRARIRRQMPWTERRKLADFIVKNDSSLSVLKRRARHCWEKIVS
ncbi:MAG: dephospho-CoA kinase [candidate division Zixibacteria bacterium]|nr:dephospho-CoA kinase [candidate division Zixibacteria bacterium]